MAAGTKETAGRFRIEAGCRRGHGEDDVISNMPNCLFGDSVPMAIGVNGIDDTGMHAYGLSGKPADIIDLQSS